jgi:hypothetical protein
VSASSERRGEPGRWDLAPRDPAGDPWLGEIKALAEEIRQLRALAEGSIPAEHAEGPVDLAGRLLEPLTRETDPALDATKADIAWLDEVRAQAEALRKRRESDTAAKPSDSATIEAEWLAQVRTRADQIRKLREAAEQAAQAAVDACDKAIEALRRRREEASRRQDAREERRSSGATTTSGARTRRSAAGTGPAAATASSRRPRADGGLPAPSGAPSSRPARAVRSGGPAAPGRGSAPPASARTRGTSRGPSPRAA